LRDGNTAIDRLYTEYYAPCDVDNETPDVSFVVEEDYTEGAEYKYKVHYSTKNMGYIKWISVKEGGILPLTIGEDWYKDIKKSIIGIKYDDTINPRKYLITLKDNRGQVVKGIIECKHVPEPSTKPLMVITYDRSYDLKNKKTKITWVSNSVKIGSVTGNKVSGQQYASNKMSGSFSLPLSGSYEVTFKDENNNLVSKLTINGFGNNNIIGNISGQIDGDIIGGMRT
jgi:hypothetical protein